jgi:hypothetical protein
MQKWIMVVVKQAQFLSDKDVERGRWCDIILLHAYVLTEDKIDEYKLFELKTLKSRLDEGCSKLLEQTK